MALRRVKRVVNKKIVKVPSILIRLDLPMKQFISELNAGMNAYENDESYNSKDVEYEFIGNRMRRIEDGTD